MCHVSRKACQILLVHPQLRASVHEQDSRNHEDIKCPGEHSRQNKMRAPMKEGDGFRRCHCDYVVLCYDTGKVSEAHCGFTLK